MIWIDTEYNDNQVLMLIALKGDAYSYFDLRDNTDKTLLEEYLRDNQEEVFASYAVHAEITALLRCGIAVDNVKCIDLMAECRMITMSHKKYFTQDGTLLGQVKCLLGKDVTKDREEKDKMRDLILGAESWTNEEWESIMLYCYSDLAELEALFKKVVEIHYEENHPYTLQHALDRGEYVRMSAEMDYASKGFPVYGDAVETIFSNKDQVKTNIIFSLPNYWKVCYERKGGKWTLKKKQIEELIRIRGWKDWRRTETGMPILKEDYLKELSLIIPEVSSLRTAIKSLNTLNSADLREQVVDGYIKPKTFAFTAVTGRNGLKPTAGYLLNLPAWLRRIINPHPDMYLAGFDWSQQEIAVAAALSGDTKLLEAYQTGDIYLALGKMSGHIPEDGTKSSHKKQRDLFKALQLGLGYGKGVQSLGYDIWGIMQEDGMSLIDAKIKAQEIFNWHKRTFNTYWEWNNKLISQARSNGWIESLDGWTEWVSRMTKDTQLKNFPSQANGAVMLRIATKKLYVAWKKGELPPLLCSQHDAVWYNIEPQFKEDHSKKISEIFKISSIETIGVHVRSDEKLFGMGKEYLPDNYDQHHAKIWDLAMEVGSKDVNLV